MMRRKGGAAVELIVAFPVILLILIGVADYGRVFFTSITVANAARAGAEWGTQDGTTNIGAQLDSVAQKTYAQQDGSDAGTLVLSANRYCQCGGTSASCTSFCPGGSAPYVYVEITATDTVKLLLPYPGLSNKVVIKRKANFRAQ